MKTRSSAALALLAAAAISSFAHARQPIEADAVLDARPEPAPKPAYLAPSQRFNLDPADPVPLIAAPAPDMPTVAAEDAAAAATGDRRRRIGVRRDLWLSTAMGRWDAVAGGGGRVWRADLLAEGADGVRAHFMNVDLPPGAELVVYALNDPARVFGPFTGRGMLGEGEGGRDGEFWAPSCFGDSIMRIEYFEPTPKPGAPERTPFVLDAIQHIYRNPAIIAAETGGLFDRVGPCHLDVTCHAAWASVAQAAAGVGTIGQTGFLFCSGQLIAASNADQTPYFLTANHCVGSPAEAASTEVYWRYGTSLCNGPVTPINSVPRSGPCTLVASGSSSDYSLIMIDGAIPSGLAWVGWVSGSQPVGTPSACVQHPDGSWKRIAFGNKTAGSVCGGPNYTRMQWTSGVTEPGSSGSGIFRTSDMKLYGQLYCGFSDCAVPLGNDDYGRFDLTFPNISAALAGGADDGFEPNNACAAARAMSVGTFNNLVVKSTSEDWYSLPLTAGQTLTTTVNLVNANGDIDTQLFTTCGGAAVAQSTTTTNTDTLTYTNTTGAIQTAFLRVYLFSDTRNSYSLTLSASGGGGPANDACAAAQTLTLNTPVSASTTTATTDGSASCGSSSGPNTAPDLWYSFTPAAPGFHRFDTVGSALDTVLSVHTACPGTAANQVAAGCNDDVASGDTTSRLDLTLAAGTTYRVRVAGYNTAVGAFTVRISALSTAPANDACANAAPVPNGATPFSTTNATTDGPDEPAACTFFSNPTIAADVWFRYTASCTGTVSVDACAGTGYDTELAVYGPACPTAGGSVIACNDDNAAACGTGSTRSALTFSAVTGGSYLIRIGGFNGATGNGTLTIACTPDAPPTGACCLPEDCSCVIDTAIPCTARGGTFTAGLSCIPNTCDCIFGACCSGPTCTITLPAACTGRFAGPFTSCNAPGNQTTPCCRADFNDSTTITVQDIFDFLAAYFSNSLPADFNTQGGITVQDIFDYLAAYFTGCS